MYVDDVSAGKTGRSSRAGTSCAACKDTGSVQRSGQLWDPCQRSAKKSSTDPEGSLGCIVAMMLMTIMYSGRVARFDLLKVISLLASRITKWDSDCDRRLHRLMCYLKKTRADVMTGWVGDDPSLLTAHLFADADFAGCPYTLKSSNGDHFDIQGPNSRVPIAGRCNGQTSTAQSSIEAELSALNSGMKNRGDPASQVFTKIMSKYHKDAVPENAMRFAGGATLLLSTIPVLVTS